MEIAEYNVTTAALAKLSTELKDKKYAVDNATGMALAKFDRRGLVTLRTDLEKKRVEIKAPALERCKLIDSEANRIKAELLLLEQPIDAQIKAQEAIEEAKRAEKARIAAEAQAVLDNMIIEIAKLPMKFINLSADDIVLNLAKLEAKEFGAEFTNGTLERAEAAKKEAIEAIRGILSATQEAEALLAEKKAAEEAERADLAIKQAELAEQKRVQDIETKRVADLAAIEQKRLDDERAAFAAEQKAVADKQAELAAIEAAKQAELQKAIDEAARIEKRVQEEEAEKQREIDRVAAMEAENARVQAVMDARKAEKARKLAEAKCATATDALKKILDICNGASLNSGGAIEQIIIICEGNL